MGGEMDMERLNVPPLPPPTKSPISSAWALTEAKSPNSSSKLSVWRVGGDVRDGEVGEDGDVDVGGETADDLERGRGGGWQWLAVVVDVVVVETDRL